MTDITTGTDLVIGAMTKYNYEQIEPWIVSLKRTGYDGKIALILYNVDKDTVNKLQSMGITLFAFQRDEQGNCIYEPEIKNGPEKFNIVVERFAHLWYFLSNLKEDVERIITTDVKDVVFQTNPSLELNKYLVGEKNLIVGSENFNYEDEPWSKNNMNMSFGPFFYDLMKSRQIYCAGIIAGNKKEFIDLCMSIFLYCRGTPSYILGGGGPDQAAMNIYLSMANIEKHTVFTTTDDTWACHAGTSLSAIMSGSGEIGNQYKKNPEILNTYKSVMRNSDPILVNELICNSKGIPYSIVHQYDRVNDWKNIIDKKYRE